MTAAEAAAQIASLTAAAQASYNAGTLFAPGALQAGQTLDSLSYAKPNNTQDAASMFSDPGLQQLNATAQGLKAGYYQLPGATGAEYFDPAQGQASQAFVTWANALTPDQLDPFTNQPLTGYIPAEGGPEAANAARLDQSAGNIATVNQIIAGGKGADGTYQDSQDRVLGIGKYQQFMLDVNGKQVRVADAVATAQGPQAAATYKDVSTYHSTLAPAPTGTMVHDVTGSWETWSPAQLEALNAWYASNESDVNAAVAANNQHNQDAYSGLQQERIARGEDPNTGISAAETKSIYDEYNRIQDPGEQAAFIQAQDPGNLTPGLRVARTAARQGQTDWMTKNAIAPVTTWEGTQKYGGSSDDNGQVKTTYGDVTQTDAATGRSIMFGNVAVKQEYVAHDVGSMTRSMDRLGGGLYGAFKGFIMSGFNPGGALLGAMQGSGALGGIKISLNRGFSDIGKSQWGAPQQPTNLGEDAVSMGLSMMGGGFFLKMMEGAAVGGAWGGGKGAAIGAISGAMQGLGGAGGSPTSWVAPTLSSMGFQIGLGSAAGFASGGWRGAGQGAVYGGLLGSIGTVKSGASSKGAAAGKYYYGG